MHALELATHKAGFLCFRTTVAVVACAADVGTGEW